jgi:hypothetical protein
MELIRYILMYEGKVEHDFKSFKSRPNLGEFISIEKEKECLNYKVEFVQYFFKENKDPQYIMVTAIRE